MTTVEEMVRQVLAACDPDVIKSVANGVDPLTLTSGDLVEAANRLSELLNEQPTMINNQAFMTGRQIDGTETAGFRAIICEVHDVFFQAKTYPKSGVIYRRGGVIGRQILIEVNNTLECDSENLLGRLVSVTLE